MEVEETGDEKEVQVENFGWAGHLSWESRGDHLSMRLMGDEDGIIVFRVLLLTLINHLWRSKWVASNLRKEYNHIISEPAIIFDDHDNFRILYFKYRDRFGIRS